MVIPKLHQAEAYLAEAALMNPGKWVNHSRNAAQAASIFASRIEGLNSETAYIMGLLHDIGRRAGVFDLVHIYHGWRFMIGEGFPDIARICITHSFLLQDVSKAENNWDGSIEEMWEVEKYLSDLEYNDYDRLIQLCDGVSIDTGYWLIEKRLLDVGIRRGVTKFSPLRWQKMLEVQHYFEKKMGCSIYGLLPGVVKNTFGFLNNVDPDK